MFTYSLESVLDYKRRIEEAQKLALAALEDQRLQENQVVDQLRSALDKCGLLPTNGWDYQNMVEYWEQLLQEIDTCNRKIIELEEQVQIKRANVVEAAVDRRKFERHREKELGSFTQAKIREEQVQLDEYGCMAFIRQRKGGDDAG